MHRSNDIHPFRFIVFRAQLITFFPSTEGYSDACTCVCVICVFIRRVVPVIRTKWDLIPPLCVFRVQTQFFPPFSHCSSSRRFIIEYSHVSTNERLLSSSSFSLSPSIFLSTFLHLSFLFVRSWSRPIFRARNPRKSRNNSFISLTKPARLCRPNGINFSVKVHSID